MIETTRANGHNTQCCLTVLLTGLPQVTDVEQIEAVLPWNLTPDRVDKRYAVYPKPWRVTRIRPTADSVPADRTLAAQPILLLRRPARAFFNVIARAKGAAHTPSCNVNQYFRIGRRNHREYVTHLAGCRLCSQVMNAVSVYAGERLGDYNFGADHPFGPARHDTFMTRFREIGLAPRCRLVPPSVAQRADIERFHTKQYVDLVQQASATGTGYLDQGDTPAFVGVYPAAARVVGTVLQAVADLLAGDTRRAFVPIAGLHHARRDAAAGFCVFNDCGVAIETLRERHGVQRIAYVDIDAHHGDGVFYAFQDDPELCVVDIHEDGRFLYPGTGTIDETGSGPARGTKLNIPLPPKADDRLFFMVWEQVEAFVDKARPEFILLQCGADSIAGDPITHMAYSSEAHRHAAARLCALADRHCAGRLLALGGGGYNLKNLADAWCAVVEAMLEADVAVT